MMYISIADTAYFIKDKNKFKSKDWNQQMFGILWSDRGPTLRLNAVRAGI